MLLHAPVSEIVTLATSEDIRARWTIKLEHSATAGRAAEPSALAATPTTAVTKIDLMGGKVVWKGGDCNHVAFFHKGLVDRIAPTSHTVVSPPCASVSEHPAPITFQFTFQLRSKIMRF
jgi:hypothetical protein